MTEASGAPSTPKRPVVVPAIGLILITVVGITALLGGLNDVPDPAPPELTKGASIDQGRYETQFIDAVVSVEKAATRFDKDKRFLDLTFKVTNQDKETTPVGVPPAKLEGAFTATSFAGSLVKITPAIKQEFGPMAFASANGVESKQLHPGVPTTVTVRFHLEESDTPPEKVTLDVASFEYTAGFNDTNFRWKMIAQDVDGKYFPEIQARVTLPVTVREAT